MLHPDDQSQTVRVSPPLARPEIDLVAGLAGAGRVVRRLWPGQPGRRSPWLPCAGGCCLVAEWRPGADPVLWLRFLARELLCPTAREPRARLSRLGLPGGHRLEGEVLLGGAGGARLLVVHGTRVRAVALDERLVPLEAPVRRGRGEVLRLGDHPRLKSGQSTER